MLHPSNVFARSVGVNSRRTPGTNSDFLSDYSGIPFRHTGEGETCASSAPGFNGFMIPARQDSSPLSQLENWGDAWRDAWFDVV